jgi:hypothetical protein
MGDTTGDNGHILEHVKENYLHGSLLVNAMRETGYSDDQIRIHYGMKLADTFKRALRKYLQKDENIRIENVHGIGFQFVCPD